MTDAFGYSEFTTVRPRKNRKSRNPNPAAPTDAFDALRAQLRQDEWFAASSQSIQSSWREFSISASPPAVLCLGLGSPSVSPVARAQLAFLAETCRLLNVAPDAVSLFDPVFSPDDIALIGAYLGMRALTDADTAAAAHALSVPTLCFMPHCDMELYDTLLRANWTPAGLARVFIVGNALQEYVDNKPSSELKLRAPAILRAAAAFERRLLPASRAWPTAFNNTAVQFLHLRPPRGIALTLTPGAPAGSDEDDGAGAGANAVQHSSVSQSPAADAAVSDDAREYSYLYATAVWGGLFADVPWDRDASSGTGSTPNKNANTGGGGGDGAAPVVAHEERVTASVSVSAYASAFATVTALVPDPAPVPGPAPINLPVELEEDANKDMAPPPVSALSQPKPKPKPKSVSISESVSTSASGARASRTVRTAAADEAPRALAAQFAAAVSLSAPSSSSAEERAVSQTDRTDCDNSDTSGQSPHGRRQ